MPVRSTAVATALLTALALLATSAAVAQTFPEPFDLSQGDYVFNAWPADSPAGTYPANMRFHRHGSASDPALLTEVAEDYPRAYNETAAARINGLGNNGFSFFNSASTQPYVGAAVLGLSTVGLQNVQVSWIGGTVLANPRPYRIRLQYRIGADGSFLDVPGPVEYVASTSGHSQTFNTLLPAAVENQPVVYLRWKYYQEEGSHAGGRPELRVDNITVVTADAPGSGTGTALVEPDRVRGGENHSLAVTIIGRSDDPDDVLTHIDLTLPAGWGPITEANVAVPIGSDAIITVEGQTVHISWVHITLSEPFTFILTSVAVPDVSGRFDFAIRTGAGSAQTVAIAEQPTILVWSTPIPIAEAGANDAQGVSTLLGEWVTIQGAVTVADQFQTGGGETGPSYLQDETGGFAVFSPSGVSTQVELGDEVILLGRVDQFFGLNQLDNSTIVIETVSTGNVVEPTVVTLADIATDGQGGVEVYEGRLVRVNGVTVNTSVWNVEGSGTNYQLNDGTATLDIRINHAVDFVGQPAPSGVFDVVGVVSQFRPSPPYIGGYQLMPRFGEDIIDEGDAPLITSAPPFEQSASPTSVTVSWTTDRLAHSEVRFLSYPDGSTGVVIDETPKTEHTLVIPNLDPATVYKLEIRTATGEDTTRIANYPVSTTAAPGTTHTIEAIFTGTVKHDIALFTPAVSGNPTPRLVQLINGAQHSLDVALYSLSGSPGTLIADALIAARNRGVQVRVIMENSTATSAPAQTLQNAGVPFITDSFGHVNDGQALHHNKFAVVDFKGGAPEDIWVMTGSWNPTNLGTFTHNQNILFIQDGSVAAAFTREFEQMWGSTTTTPSASAARFGANKTLVSPSVVWIGDVYARLFFSPQGFGVFGTTEQQIINALNTAEHAIDLGLNLITRISLVNAMHARFLEGVDVRGVVGETTTTGSVFNQLASWADVHDHDASQYGLMHHKYALIDAEYPWHEPKVITGSHNWSRSANESNDENTLIIYDNDLANQFLQEYAVRYAEAGGQAPITTEPVDSQALPFSLSGNYPNPFVTSTTFEYILPVLSQVTITVYDLQGRQIARVLHEAQEAGTHRVHFDASGLSSGVYFFRLEAQAGAQRFSDTGRMTVVR